VDGLQVADVTRFRRVGMQSLFQLLDRNTQDSLNRGDEVILNVTGGFKSVVPYVTLFGLLHQLPVVYLFERSRSLLRLPPVPVAFDYERLGQAIDAMRLLENEVIPREAFFAAIPGLEYHRRDWYECLIEEDEGLVTLSAFGSLLLRQRLAEQAEVWIGPGAQRQYAAAGGTTKDQFTFMLDRVADPLWRKAKTHAFAGTDLTVFKPGNTSERMAAIVRDGRIYVCELLQHDEYERTLPGRRAEQYALKEFRPWTRPADAPEPPATEEQAYRDLLTSLDSARAQLESSRSECTRVSAGVAAAEQDLVKANAEAQDLRRESEELRRQVRSLQADLAEARRPWWKVLLRLR
jgi:hypothetical protein